MRKVDAIIIGSGQGGVPLAVKWARAGKQVCLFERSRLGGTCTNWGCTPSKAFLGAAHMAGNIRLAAKLGIQAEVRVDFPKVMARVRQIRDQFTQGVEKRVDTDHLHVLPAEARFTPEGHIHADGVDYDAPLVVIDTGSRAADLPIPGLADCPYLTDRNFWDLEHLPRRTLVLGGGYIGLELGQGLARLGSEVHIIDRDERVMSRESEGVSAVLAQALQRDGVQLHLEAQVERAGYRDGLFQLYLQGEAPLEGDALLVAVGRRPNTDALDAGAAGIEMDQKGYIQVDERFETTRPGVYAIGEVAGQPPFTNVSWEDHLRLLDILEGGPRTRDDRVLAYAAFTDPQLGRAGLSMAQARAKGLNAREARMEIKQMARAIEWGHDLGFYEMVVDADNEHILGATLVGYEAAELVHVIVDLMETGATWRTLARGQHIHPAYAENLPSLARLFAEA